MKFACGLLIGLIMASIVNFVPLSAFFCECLPVCVNSCRWQMPVLVQRIGLAEFTLVSGRVVDTALSRMTDHGLAAHEGMAMYDDSES